VRKYVFGINTVEEILKNSTRRIHRLIVENTSGSRLMHLIKLANKKKIGVQFTHKRLMDKLTNQANHQNIILEVDDVNYYSLDEAINMDKSKKDIIWLCLDSITDPQNFGSIIRTSVCMGVSVIIFCENRSVRVTPSVEKIASGAVEKIKFVKVININQSLIYLKENNFWIYGSDVKGIDVRDIRFNFPLVLVMGSEGEGIHQKTKEHCDELIKIPQIADFDSLNVSIATALCLYEIRRRI
jgi:23S rRNA (guanosine2251-2'-O)-methyltransferase